MLALLALCWSTEGRARTYRDAHVVIQWLAIGKLRTCTASETEVTDQPAGSLSRDWPLY